MVLNCCDAVFQILRERVNNIRNNLKREGVEGEDYIVEEQEEEIEPAERTEDDDPEDKKNQRDAN